MNTVPNVRNRVFLIAMLTPAFASLIAIPQPQQEPSHSEARSTVAVKDGMVTLRVQEQSLRSILEQIGRKAEVAIVVDEGVGEEPVSVDFEGRPLDEALRQILKSYDAFFFYGFGEGKGSSSLKAVWVYPRAKGGRYAPAPSLKRSRAEDLGRMLRSPESGVRAQAVEELIERKGRGSGDAVLEALKDPSDDVRTRALYQALESGVEIPEEVLIDVALNHESENVRFLALRAVSRAASLRWVVEKAAVDPNGHIAEAAQEMLKQLDAAAKPPTALDTTEQQQPPDQ